MIGFPPCKINLGLQVLRKRSDGYHDVDTCFYPLPFTDVLEVLPARSFSFHLSGIALPGNRVLNLCVRAWQLMHDRFNTPEADVYLHKCIPPGAGLGGGSANAAWMLRLLRQLFHPSMAYEELLPLAARLGSDCPFFLTDSPMMGSGRGEVLQPAPVSLKGYYLVVLKPNVHLSTAEAYARIVPDSSRQPVAAILRAGIHSWKHLLVNDFEAPAFQNYPVIGHLKESLYNSGACYASMSGSGSAVYGIFEKACDLPSFLRNYVIWEGEL